MAELYEKKKHEPTTMFMDDRREGKYPLFWFIVNTLAVSFYTVMALGVLYRGCGLDKFE